VRLCATLFIRSEANIPSQDGIKESQSSFDMHHHKIKFLPFPEVTDILLATYKQLYSNMVHTTALTTSFELSVPDSCAGRNQTNRTNAALEPNIYLRLLAMNVKKEMCHNGPGCWVFDDMIKPQIARILVEHFQHKLSSRTRRNTTCPCLLCWDVCPRGSIYCNQSCRA
jgi:hypothetical protein